MIMNTTFGAAGEVRAPAGNSLGTAFVKRALLAYNFWRRERTAVVELGTMTERELRDIGLIPV
jgi:uncharacterized protein YjiS (DUF1127 family)